MPTGYIIHIAEPVDAPQASLFLAQFVREEAVRKPTIEELRDHSLHLIHQRFFANYTGIYRRAPSSWRFPGVVRFNDDKIFEVRELYQEWEELFLKMKDSRQHFEALVLPHVQAILEGFPLNASTLDLIASVRKDYHLPTRIPFFYSKDGEITRCGYEYENRHDTSSDRRITGAVQRHFRRYLFDEDSERMLRYYSRPPRT